MSNALQTPELPTDLTPLSAQAPAHLLLVEDDEKIAAFLTKGLQQAGATVRAVGSAEEAFVEAKKAAYDLMIVDVMLPGADGLVLIDQLRKAGVTTPVIILSAKRSVDDRIRGLQGGGDDYITKPFAFTELMARIQAVLRRASGAGEVTKLAVGGLKADLLSREVTRDGRHIELQPREFALLEYLMRNAGKVVSKTMIMEHVWDYNFDPETNVVEARVCKLREKLEKNAPKLIHTIRGVGYVLREEPQTPGGAGR